MSPHQISTPSRTRSLPVFQVTLLALFLLLCAVGIVSSTAQAPQAGRGLEDKIPKHLPIKVKVKNLNNEKWTRELEIEVKNTGEKPIYLLDFALVTSEIKSDRGHDLGIVVVHYGRGALVDFNEPLQPDDIPIKPGETHTFNISEAESRGWENFSKRRNLPNDAPKKVRLVFGELNFGDGTGFTTTGGVPIDIHRKVSMNCDRGKDDASSVASKFPPNFPPDSSEPSRSFFLPASFLPVNFSLEKSATPSFAASTSGLDTCCPGQPGCSRRRNGRYTCCLGEASTTQTASCTDPRGVCSIDYELDREGVCDEFGTVCPEFFLDPCPPPDSMPTPTPTPTPTETPTPTATPTPTPVCDEDCTLRNPLAYCGYPPGPGPSTAYCHLPDDLCFYGPSADFVDHQTGCPDTAYLDPDRTYCCRCVEQNCPAGTALNNRTCTCEPTSSGGGGGNPPAGGGGGGGGYFCETSSFYFTVRDGGWKRTYQQTSTFCSDGWSSVSTELIDEEWGGIY